MRISLQELRHILANNQGVVIVKFSATWCGPCKQIKPYVDQYAAQMPQHVRIIHVDVDESIEVFSFFKNKKMANGIPAMLAYFKGNDSHIPNEIAIGSDLRQLDQFFKKCASFVPTVV
jgi:thiol-disulfide isomerase/thioredoxin